MADNAFCKVNINIMCSTHIKRGLNEKVTFVIYTLTLHTRLVPTSSYKDTYTVTRTLHRKDQLTNRHRKVKNKR